MASKGSASAVNQSSSRQRAVAGAGAFDRQGRDVEGFHLEPEPRQFRRVMTETTAGHGEARAGRQIRVCQKLGQKRRRAIHVPAGAGLFLVDAVPIVSASEHRSRMTA